MAHPTSKITVLALAAALGASQALAQSASSMGGGFLELLITGRDPTPRPWLAQPTPTPRAAGATSVQRARPLPASTAAANAAHDLVPPQAPTVIRSASVAPRPVEGSRDIATRFARQEVAYDGPHGPGEIIVDTPNRFLFLVLGNGRALRYGIGVGRPGFEWAGVKSVTRKAEWPGWTPPPEMLKRRPELPRHMAGGEDNPLGARALYLGSSLYRIHGTNEPQTIGHNVSSGCIRMMNEDVMDLYERVKVGTKVVVI